MSEDGPIIYADERLPVYLDDAASGKPAPGGGSVSACVGALGAALDLDGLQPDRRQGAVRRRRAAHEGGARRFRGRARPPASSCCRTTRRPTTASSSPTGCRRTRREQKAARHRPCRTASSSPPTCRSTICRVALEVCRLARMAAELGNPNAVTDAGIGALLGEARRRRRRPERANQPRLDRGRGVRAAGRRPRSTRSSPRRAALRAEVLATTRAKI